MATALFNVSRDGTFDYVNITKNLTIPQIIKGTTPIQPAGSVGYQLSDGKLYYSNGTDWIEVCSCNCTEISEIPAGGLTISESGCYIVTKELSYDEAGGLAIYVAPTATDVLIDGGGFTLTLGGTSFGIFTDSCENFTIKNLRIVTPEQSGDSNNYGLYISDANIFRITDVYTSTLFRGIQVFGSKNGYFTRLVQENHGYGINGDDIHSAAIRIYGGSCFTFDECKWTDDSFAAENPWEFGDTDAIAFVGSLDPSPIPVQFGVNFQNCQFVNSNIIGYDVSNFIVDKCNFTMTIPYPYPLLEFLESYDHLSIRDSTFRSYNTSYIQGLVALFDTRGAIIENCTFESTASGIGQAGSPWPVASFPCLINIGGIRNGDSITVRGCQLIGGPAGNRLPPIATPKPSIKKAAANPLKIPAAKTTSSSSKQKKDFINTLIRENRKNALLDKPITRPKITAEIQKLKAEVTDEIVPRALIGIIVSSTAASSAQGVTIDNNTLSHFNSGSIPIPPPDPSYVQWLSEDFGAAILVLGGSGVVIKDNKITDVANGGPDRGPGNGIVLAEEGSYLYWFTVAAVQTTADFVQPNVGDSVSVSVTDTSTILFFISNAADTVYIFNGGYYTLLSIDSSTTITLQNLGGGSNVSPGTTVPSGNILTGVVFIPPCVCCTVTGNIVTNCEGTGIADYNSLGNNRVVNNIAYSNGINYDIPDSGTIVATTSPALAGQNVQ